MVAPKFDPDSPTLAPSVVAKIDQFMRAVVNSQFPPAVKWPPSLPTDEDEGDDLFGVTTEHGKCECGGIILYVVDVNDDEQHWCSVCDRLYDHTTCPTCSEE